MLSLFSNDPAMMAQAEAVQATAKKAKPKGATGHTFGILDYLPDITQFRKQTLKFKIDASELTPDALSQRPGMEWIGQCQFYLVSPQSRDLTEQKNMLLEVIRTLKQKASRINASLCPQFPLDMDEPILALDLESTGLDLRTLYKLDEATGLLNLDRKVEIVGVCLAISQFEAYYLPWMHTEEDGILNFDFSLLTWFLTELNQQFFTVLHNTQYDREVMAQHDVVLRPAPYFSDTQILHYVWDVNNKQHGLKYLSKTLLGRLMLGISELFGGKDEHVSFELLSATQAYVYGASDAMNTFGLFYYFCSLQDSPYKLQPIPITVDLKIADTCRSMYRTGAPVNLQYYWITGLDCVRQVEMIQIAIDELAGYSVSIGSPKQLSTLLFDEFKIPPLQTMERNKSGSYGTGEEILEELLTAYPDFTILKYIVLYRKLKNYISKSSAKILSNSFVDDYQPYARVQFSFSQTVIPTGRLSSNSSDGVERVSVKTNKTSLSYSYTRGDGSCGFNSQGVTSSSFRKAKAKRIKALPPEAGLDPQNLYPEKVVHALIEATAKQ